MTLSTETRMIEIGPNLANLLGGIAFGIAMLIFFWLLLRHRQE